MASVDLAAVSSALSAATRPNTPCPNRQPESPPTQTQGKPADPPSKNLPEEPALEDQTITQTILGRINRLSSKERSQRQLVLLYSDTFSPILKYHTQLLSQLVDLLPLILTRASGSEKDSKEDTPPSPTAKPIESKATSLSTRVLSVILSLKSDGHLRATLPDPFRLDLFDRKRLIHLQLSDPTFPIPPSKVILEETWAHRMDCGQSVPMLKDMTLLYKSESEHILRILDHTSRLSRIKPLELVHVLEQSEIELNGIPEELEGKVVFVISKEPSDRQKSLQQAAIHWVDRLFLRRGYSEEWIQSNLIPVYIRLPGALPSDDSYQRSTSSYPGYSIHLPTKRPSEALTRVKTREGQGRQVLEDRVLDEIERTQIFEMLAIRKPMFTQLMGAMSLGLDSKEESKEDQADGNDDGNPFL